MLPETYQKPMVEKGSLVIRTIILCLGTLVSCSLQESCTGTDGELLESLRFNIPDYTAEHLLIRRTGEHPNIPHSVYPSTKTLMFTPIFDRLFLKKVIKLHNDIRHMKVWTGSKNMNLNDICYRQSVLSKSCVTPSVLEYYQGLYKNIKMKVMDEYNEFVLANYLDHFLSCTSNPEAVNDGTRLNMSCIATYNQPVEARTVVCGYTGTDYKTSTHLVLTYIIKDPKKSKVSAKWKRALLAKIREISVEDMTIDVYEVTEGHSVGPLKF